MDQKLIHFQQAVKKYPSKEKSSFSRVANKLLAVNFICYQKEDDLEDYFYITQHFDLFQSYFSMMDYVVTYDALFQIIALENLEHYNKLHLKLDESIVLLILRLLFDEKRKELSLSPKIVIELAELHDYLFKIGLKDRRISKTEFKQILMRFKHYHLIDLLEGSFDQDESRLELYPSLLYAVPLKNIDAMVKQLQSYQKEGVTDEDISED